MSDDALTYDGGEALVRQDFACPNCGERRVDYLLCRDDDLVECHSCGTAYDPLFTPESLRDGADEPVVTEQPKEQQP
jgi:rubredoxin